MFVEATVNPVVTQITWSALVVALIQWLKNSKWMPMINADSAKLNRIVAGILAAAAAIGIHMSWTHGSVPGSYMIGVTGLTLTGIALGLWGWIKSMVFQELIYRTAVKPHAPQAKEIPPKP